jgi:hypothetical protein
MKTQIHLQQLSHLPLVQRLSQWVPLVFILAMSWLLPAAKRAAKPYVIDTFERAKSWAAHRKEIPVAGMDEPSPHTGKKA